MDRSRSPEQDPAAPLAGIVVADFSRVLAGPLASMTLADLGARVIKIERPGSGDDTRAWGPPHSQWAATYFESVNRNKESVCLDLRDDDDLRVARSIVRRADVLIENFRPGTMDGLGLGYDALRAEHPGLIYASVTGFGSRAGASLPGYDFVVQAVGGLMHITGETDGPPTKAGVALVDVLTGKDAAIGILAALQRRRTTGAGSRIEVNLLSSLQGALANQAAAVLGAGAKPRRIGNDHPSIVPYQLVNCADGPLAIACGNDGQFARLVTALGAQHLADDPRFATNGARVRHREELIPLLEEQLVTRTAEAWQRSFTAIGVPAGVIGDIESGIELADALGLDPTIELVSQAGEPRGRQIRHPIEWAPGFETPRNAPPGLGEHSDRVRAWIDD